MSIVIRFKNKTKKKHYIIRKQKRKKNQQKPTTIHVYRKSIDKIKKKTKKATTTRK